MELLACSGRQHDEARFPRNRRAARCPRCTIVHTFFLAGFLLFRLFDIWKPFPVRNLEKLPGGWGIMADDWLAGVYAAILLKVALHFSLL